MTRLRIWSWLCIFASPLVIIFFGLSASIFFEDNDGCSVWGCLAWALMQIVILFFIYIIFLLIGIMLNVIDFIKIRKTASAWRKLEIIIFTTPIWLCGFAISGFFQDHIEWNKIQDLEPYVETVKNYESVSYGELLIAMDQLSSANPESLAHFPGLNSYLKDAQVRINQIDFINNNKTRAVPSDFSLDPFRLCIKDMALPSVNEPWRITFYKGNSEFHEMSVLSDSDFLITGNTDDTGCSKVVDTSALSVDVLNGNTLFFVIGSQVIFADIDRAKYTLFIQHSISKSHFEIDIQPIY